MEEKNVILKKKNRGRDRRFGGRMILNLKVYLECTRK